jgi:hypothetical protein
MKGSNWLEDLSVSVTRYYDTITDEEKVEDEQWGRFAATQFPDCSYHHENWKDDP